MLEVRAAIIFGPALTWGYGSGIFILSSWVKTQKAREGKQATSLKDSPNESFLNKTLRYHGEIRRR